MRNIAATENIVDESQRRAGGAGVCLRVGNDAVMIFVVAILQHHVAVLLTGILQTQVQRPFCIARTAVPHGVGITRFIQRPVENRIAVDTVIRVIIVAVILQLVIGLVIVKRQLRVIIHVFRCSIGTNIQVVRGFRERLQQSDDG